METSNRLIKTVTVQHPGHSIPITSAFGYEETVGSVLAACTERWATLEDQDVRLCKENGHPLDPRLTVGEISAFSQITLHLVPAHLVRR